MRIFNRDSWKGGEAMIIETIGQLRSAIAKYSDDIPLYGYNDYDENPLISLAEIDFEKDDTRDKDGNKLKNGILLMVA
jgi:hypothetical protein